VLTEEQLRNVPKRRFAIISFSGIDGAGKSTQIQALETWLKQSGLQVSNLSMWDDVVVGARWREFASRSAFGGDQGIGSPESPLERRDKNVTSGPLELIRLCLYLADAVSLSLRVRQLRNAGNQDVVIFDRYIYDELANLRLERRLARFLIQMILRLVPNPDFACIVDVVPEVARLRKPEYPLEFLHRNRQAYLALREFATNLVVVENSTVEKTAMKIRAAVLPILSQSRGAEPAVSVAMPH
jgi:thymidylate kinase